MTAFRLTTATVLSAILFMLQSSIVLAQEPGVWAVRVLATDAEAIATFYSKTFGMSEVSRPVNSQTTKEILLDFGVTPDLAKQSTAPGIIIYTRPPGTPAGAMASLLMRVADLDKAIALVTANGGTVMRPPSSNAVAKVRFVFVKDPDGNQIELVTEQK
jgi:predicted enzyme related to lactoylglutathione lyase